MSTQTTSRPAGSEGVARDHPRPGVTADAVVFTIRDSRLEVLLVQRGREPFAGSWALPGGFTEMEESIDETVARELAEETGLAGVWLEQLKTFDRPRRLDAAGRIVDAGRDPRGRTISVAYFGLVGPDSVPTAGDDAARVGWFAVDRLPALAFDHHEILEYALFRLRNKLEYSAVAFHFLPEVFTLPRLQGVYEAVLGEAIDRRNFRKKVLESGAVEPTGDASRQARGRPARLYRFTSRQFGLRAWR
ncbi:MAG: NUDIX hydrolase [Candidatus Dormibacteria bacterium]